MFRVVLLKSRFLWIVAVTSLITFLFLRQVQLVWKPPSFENHKFWSYNLDQEEPLLPDQKCQLPRVHPFDPSILGYLSPPRAIKCKERQHSLTFIDDGGVLRFNETSLNISQYEISDLTCFYQEIIRENDFEVSYGVETRLPQNGSVISSDFVYVSCSKFAGIAIYSNIHCHIVPKIKVEPLHEKNTKHTSPFNVLIIGIDSISRLTFIRQLPETYEYLTKELKAFIFKGMTKVADNTFPNLAAVLTGKSVFDGELPKVEAPTGSYDEWPCVWKNFSNENYATLFAEDQPKISLFNYLRGGLKNPPTDHYMRPFWLAVQTSKLLALSSNLCLGNVPKHLLLLNYTRSFIQKYNANKVPFFSFSYLVELSHDYVSLVSAADADFKSWLSDLYNSGLLKNTFLFFLSDHGHRFDAMRATLIGRIEERMPFVSLVVPPSLYKTHPHIIENLKLNERRLTTPYDIYFSLLDVLSQSVGKSALGSATSHRGTSLLGSISVNRTCEAAGIPDHYCVCESEQALDISDLRSIKAADVLLFKINDLVQSRYGNFCAELTVAEIVRADLIILSQKVIVNSRMYFGKLKQDYRAKGMLGKLRIIVRTTPGNALFEATLEYREDDDSYSVLGDISRINLYGSQSACIDDATLRKFCYCRNLVKLPD